MRFFTLFVVALCALCAHAAVVEGVILDDETGNTLARTQVTLTPLPGTEAEATTVRTGSRGAFVILSVRPGWYVLRATRRGYAPAEDGQSKPSRPGHAFEVADDRAGSFHEVHMAHLAAITGAVLDENGVGIPRWPVHIYTPNKPMRHLATTETDDRGEYRIGELNPGNYLLRSGPGPLEDGTTVLATYSRAAAELKDAVGATARIGQTTPNITIRPVKGKLLTVDGLFLAPPWPGYATLTLITDTGRRQISAGSGNLPFSAKGVQPGPIELVVAGADAIGNICGSYYAVIVEKDLSDVRAGCNPITAPGIQVSGVTHVPVIVRRVNLDGVSDTHVFDGKPLIPGHWEISVPRGDYYVQDARSYGRALAQSGDWYGFEVASRTSVQITLSTRYATITGTVSVKDSPVTGAPVVVTQTTTGQSWTVRSDPQGKYSVIGLGPGTYTLISSFNVDDLENTARKLVNVTVHAGDTIVQPMELLFP